MLLTDRTRIVQDWTCPRSRYWLTEYAGTGIVPARPGYELSLGDLTHQGLARLLRGEAVAPVATALGDTLRASLEPEGLEGDDWEQARVYQAEQGCLLEGLLKGWHSHVLPILTRDYTIVAIEQELCYHHEEMIFMARPDLIVRDRERGSYWYIEWKTTSYVKDDWFRRWDDSPQVMSVCRPVQETLGIELSGMIVWALAKGTRSYGRQQSPLCYGYRRMGQPPLVPTQYRHDYAAGWTRFPAWDHGVDRWLTFLMEHEVLGNLFPQTGPILIRPHLVEAFFAQASWREQQIAAARSHPACEDQGILDRMFPQHFDRCLPIAGFPCPYRDCCHVKPVGEDPLGSGLFVRRVPHHAMEA